MKIGTLSSVIFTISFLFSCSVLSAAELQLNSTPAEVYFSPGQGCTAALAKEIGRAKSRILMQAYSFTSEEIAAALIQAHKRGIEVQLLLDKSNLTAKSSAAAMVARQGIPTHIDAAHAIANNKVVVIDGTTVITGSFNFTMAAEEKNAENLLVIRNRELAGIYAGNWKRHREHAKGQWKKK